MKKVIFLIAITFACQLAAKAQFSVGADLVSRYIWRGLDYGNAPAIQPTIEFAAGNFSIGAWGSYSLGSTDNASSFREADLYASYGFDFGLSVGITDYYYPGTKWGEFGNEISSHAFELNAGYELEKLSISANYMLNNSIYGAGAEDGIVYFELGYAFKSVDIFVGGGDGWHSTTGNFEISNVGIGTSKDIKITDSFSLPLFGQAIVNPNTEQFHIVVGLSL